MNWYKVSNFNDSNSRKIVSYIIKDIKQKYKNNKNKYTPINGAINIDQLNIEDEKLKKHIVKYNIKYLSFSDEKEYFTVSAFFDEKTFPPSISLFIYINYEYANNIDLILEKLYYKLIETVRHEVTHVYQNYDQQNELIKKIQFTYNILEKEEQYLLADTEVQSYVEGLYFRAKKERKPFTVVLDEFLKPRFFTLFKSNKNLDLMKVKEVFDKVKKHWIEYANNKYPNVK